jgi:hypothetical protein
MNKQTNNINRGGSDITPAHKNPPFKFKDYMPLVFRHLREKFKIDPSEYMVCCLFIYCCLFIIYLFVFVFRHLRENLKLIRLFVCLLISGFSYVFVCLFVCLFVCVFIHLFFFCFFPSQNSLCNTFESGENSLIELPTPGLLFIIYLLLIYLFIFIYLFIYLF